MCNRAVTALALLGWYDRTVRQGVVMVTGDGLLPGSYMGSVSMCIAGLTSLWTGIAAHALQAILMDVQGAGYVDLGLHVCNLAVTWFSTLFWYDQSRVQ